MVRLFAVELFFNKEFDEYVRKVWMHFDKKGISYFMNRFENLSPHITLAVYTDISDLKGFKEQLEIYFDNVSPLRLRFDIVATFPTSGTIFLAPTMTEELQRLHKDYYNKLDKYNNQASIYYSPDQWNPHCTLGTQLRREAIAKGIHDVVKGFEPMDGIIERMSLVKIELSEEGNRNITIFEQSFES